MGCRDGCLSYIGIGRRGSFAKGGRLRDARTDYLCYLATKHRAQPRWITCWPIALRGVMSV